MWIYPWILQGITLCLVHFIQLYTWYISKLNVKKSQRHASQCLYLREVSDLQDVCLARSVINSLPFCCHVFILVSYCRLRALCEPEEGEKIICGWALQLYLITGGYERWPSVKEFVKKGGDVCNSWDAVCADLYRLCLNSSLPIVHEEAVLDQKIKNKEDKAFHCHESYIFPHKVPPERVLCELLTWRQIHTENEPLFSTKSVVFIFHKQYKYIFQTVATAIIIIFV